jgi:hypothetical protein
MFAAGDIVISEFMGGRVESRRPRPYYAVVHHISNGMVYGHYSYTVEEAIKWAEARQGQDEGYMGCLEIDNVRLYQPAKPLQETILRGKHADIHIFT